MFIFAVRFLVSWKRKKKPGDPLTCRIIACVEVIYNEHLGDGFKT